MCCQLCFNHQENDKLKLLYGRVKILHTVLILSPMLSILSIGFSKKIKKEPLLSDMRPAEEVPQWVQRLPTALVLAWRADFACALFCLSCSTTCSRSRRNGSSFFFGIPYFFGLVLPWLPPRSLSRASLSCRSCRSLKRCMHGMQQRSSFSFNVSGTMNTSVS